MLAKERGKDGTIWRCGGRACGRSKSSIRTNSWFGDAAPIKASNLPLTTHLLALYQFSLGASQKVATEALSRLMTKKVVSAWFNLYRELMTNDMLANPIRLGGRGHVVQVDESYFSGKRKYHRGRMIRGVPEPWIVGLIDTTTKKVAMFSVHNRTGDTLIPLIEQYVLPNTTVITDGWAGYNGLGASPNNYTHRVVNHEENFVDPQTQAHTQEIEGFWTSAKAKFKDARGFPPEVRPLYLDEIQWRWNNKDCCCFVRLLEILSTVHDPNQAYAHAPQAVLARKPVPVYP